MLLISNQPEDQLIYIIFEGQDNEDKMLNPLKTSPVYTRAGVYGKCVL